MTAVTPEGIRAEYAAKVAYRNEQKGALKSAATRAVKDFETKAAELGIDLNPPVELAQDAAAMAPRPAPRPPATKIEFDWQPSETGNGIAAHAEGFELTVSTNDDGKLFWAVFTPQGEMQNGDVCRTEKGGRKYAQGCARRAIAAARKSA